jgi:hypothetical protein
MPTGGWINRPATVVFAITVLLIVLTWTGDTISRNWVSIHNTYATYQQYAEDDRTKAAIEAAETCQDLPLIELRECIGDQLQAYYHDQATNKDLQAQQDMAFWAFWLFAVSIVGLLVSVAGVALLIRSISLGLDANIQATKAANAANEANHILRDENRAWIKIEFHQRNVTIADGQVRVGIGVNPRNVGSKPAKNPLIFYKEVSLFNLNTAGQKKILTDFVKGAGVLAPLDSIIFPGELGAGFVPEIAFPSNIRSWTTWLMAASIYDQGDGTHKRITCVTSMIDVFVDPKLPDGVLITDKNQVTIKIRPYGLGVTT